MGCFPSILMCPFCGGKMKQRNLPQRKRTVCAFCRRRYPVWEARIFVQVNQGYTSPGRTIEVTEAMKSTLLHMHDRYGRPKEKATVAI